jgi:hypothetical protein
MPWGLRVSCSTATHKVLSDPALLRELLEWNEHAAAIKALVWLVVPPQERAMYWPVYERACERGRIVEHIIALFDEHMEPRRLAAKTRWQHPPAEKIRAWNTALKKGFASIVTKGAYGLRLNVTFQSGRGPRVLAMTTRNVIVSILCFNLLYVYILFIAMAACTPKL